MDSLSAGTNFRAIKKILKVEIIGPIWIFFKKWLSEARNGSSKILINDCGLWYLVQASDQNLPPIQDTVFNIIFVWLTS